VCRLRRRQLLRWLQKQREKPPLEVTVSLAGTYLAFYVTNVWLEASGEGGGG
jgi:hypothetical protein